MISIVIPVFDEEASLQTLHGELEEVREKSALDWEIIFVDDGSADGTWEIIRQIALSNPHVRGLRLRRNFGKSYALAEGFAAARGSIIGTMDGDLQDDPAEIPHFIEALNHADVVCGWKKHRHDPLGKIFPSRIFNILVSRLTGVRLHDHNCGMKFYRSDVLKGIRLYGENYRFLAVLAADRGYRIAELPIHHRARKYGKSKFGISRFFRGFMDILLLKFLLSYRHRPQHLLGSIGFGTFTVGFVGMSVLGGEWIIRLWSPSSFLPIHERPLLIYSIAFLIFGTQMISLAFLAGLLIAQEDAAKRVSLVAESAGVTGQQQ